MPFAKLGLTKPLLRRVQSMGYGVATPIQLRALSPALKGRHLKASAQTDAQTFSGFRSGRCKVMVATDIAARGIDVGRISHMTNYDPPEDCVGGVGATGRAQHASDGFTLVTPEDLKLLAPIEHFIGQKIERLATEGFAEANLVRAQLDLVRPDAISRPIKLTTVTHESALEENLLEE